MFALGSLLARGLDIDCGCFGPDPTSKTSPAQALWRDAGLLLLLLATWVLRYRQHPPEPE
jgi:hypothetical protein